MLKPSLCLLFGLVLTNSALAQNPDGKYTDSPTAQWFRELNILIPGTTEHINCCDQSDCHQTKADWRGGPDGAWWAESRIFPGEWLKIPPGHVLTGPNPLQNAVLCEAKGGRQDFFVRTEPSGKDLVVYCFEPPPSGT